MQVGADKNKKGWRASRRGTRRPTRREAKERSGRQKVLSSVMASSSSSFGRGERESIRFRGRGGEQGEYEAGEVITEYIHPPRCHSNANDNAQQRTTTDARANQVYVAGSTMQGFQGIFFFFCLFSQAITNEDSGTRCTASYWSTQRDRSPTRKRARLARPPVGRLDAASGRRPSARTSRPTRAEGMGCRGRGFLLATCEL